MNNIILKNIEDYNVSVFDIENDKQKINFINQYISKIYVINLLDNTLRRNYILLLMKKFNINFRLVVVERVKEDNYKNITKALQSTSENQINSANASANLLTKEEIGCCLSHLWCLKNIIDNKYDKSIVFEDDIIFHKHFLKLFEKIFEKEKENPYDFLLLGCCDNKFNILNKKNVKDGLYYPNMNTKMLYGAHANFYSLNAAKQMFEYKITNFSFFDSHYLFLFKLFKETSFICCPNLVVTDLSTSNLNHEYFLLTYMEKNYYLNCFHNFKFTDYYFIYLDVIEKYGAIDVDEKDTYETYMNKLVDCYFFMKTEREEIQNRLAFNLFTIKELKTMMMKEL